MMIRFRHWLFLCLLGLALPSPVQPARAEDGRNGYYMALTRLLVIPRDSEWTEHLLDAPVTFDLPTKNGFGVLGVLGYSLASRLRGEGEIGYRGFDLDESGGVRIDGRFDTLSFMINGVYDFEAGPVRPYVGGGFGLAWHELEIDPTMPVDEQAGPSERDTGDKISLAYQAMLGVGYSMTDRIDLHLGYRYFGTTETDFGEPDVTYGTHNVEVGVRYR
ncbi:MAG: outer membrane beta-barrel protein [Defluviicoccus sp.]|nr:outer membrane beta-barrel protein [Defluviicoccus sp.]MDE0386104.1 outer membrane beta-barrel protein [Defluviicoccus sp.]